MTIRRHLGILWKSRGKSVVLQDSEGMDVFGKTVGRSFYDVLLAFWIVLASMVPSSFSGRIQAVFDLIQIRYVSGIASFSALSL